MPTHAPSEQAWLPQSMGAPHVPDDAHTWTALFEHRTAPAVHGPPPSLPESPSSWAASTPIASPPPPQTSETASSGDPSAP